MDVLYAAWTLLGAGLAFKLGSRVWRGGPQAEASFRRLAEAFDMEVMWGWGGDRVLTGTAGDLPVHVRVERQPPLLHLSISIDARGRVPRTFWAVSHDHSTDGGVHLPPPIVTGDLTFDGNVRIHGGVAFLSLLDSLTRLFIRTVGDRGSLRIQAGWIESDLDIRESDAPTQAGAQIRDLVEVARRLSRPTDPGAVEQRLFDSSVNDPVFGVRKKSLEVLVEHGEDDALIGEALEAALASKHPELELFAARHLDDASSRQAIRAFADAEEAPGHLRAEALFHLAATEPSKNLDLFERALRSPIGAVQLAALGGLAQVELRFLPLLRMVDRARDDLEPAVLEALLSIFDRIVEEEGAHVPQEVAERVRDCLDDFGEEAEQRRGRLSVVVPRAEQGAISLPNSDGKDVALCPDRPDEDGRGERGQR